MPHVLLEAESTYQYTLYTVVTKTEWPTQRTLYSEDNNGDEEKDG